MFYTCVAGLLTAAALSSAALAYPSLKPVVEVEEDVYTYESAGNGAGPLWCHGSTCIVRTGDDVFIAGLETLPDYQPLNNVRWLLFKRGPDGWGQVADGGDTHEREPCPLVVFPGGPVFLSANPNTSAPDEYDGIAHPEILEFSAARPEGERASMAPRWNRPLEFHGHTYRSFAADAAAREFILMYNTAYDKVYWTFRNSAGEWAAQGELDFPWGAEYDTPQPVRVCYPNVAIKDRRVYFCGVSDILEPYGEWRRFQEEKRGRASYDFRRLFFTWSDDITSGEFHPWVEIASRDSTAGSVSPCDLWVDEAGDVHLLWTEQSTRADMRERFFPEVPITHELNYAVVRNGEVVCRRPVLVGGEGQSSQYPGKGRFHVTAQGRLFIIHYAGGTDAEGTRVSENRVVEVLAGHAIGEPVVIPLQHPFTSFMTATWRAGCAPSDVVDLYGNAAGLPGTTMRYARVRLAADTEGQTP